ncbi:tripartite tricarboxylate transporter substrate binding protein [Xenophilus arseniciresistens]|uniref:Tripartite tricarboxylate transporter substrate binding protein n=1 Tax=Xenophilus arseniciresistens TaxID=1283306 RepID=A0AAE3T2P4_9BURK|nr:tripartite tricarboxylate transporter substrate binding protein [Xenophilus arseniciresistens]MDA7418627.1 tripartite tricarboxylate transporter substrate binding protein [Xenophilus arseniciresistens]
MKRRSLLRLLPAVAVPGAAAAWSPSLLAATPAFPSGVIKIVVPFAAGGSSDLLARAIAKSMGESLKATVIVDNRPGAGGVIAMEAVMAAPADGHTLLLATNGTHSIGPALYPGRRIDPLKAFAPVARMHKLANVLLLNPQVPARNVAELIAHAKANPGMLSFASAGNGSASHLFGELFKSQAGVELMHVPYRGGSAAMPDLASGAVSMMFETIPNALAQVKGGRVRALGVTTATRAAGAPEIPTIAESGLPGFDVASWSGLCAPAGTPPAVLALLNAQANQVSRDPAYLQVLANLAVEPVIETAEAMDAYTRQDLARWQQTVKAAKIQLD